MAISRLPIVRIDQDGTVTDGTAAWDEKGIRDFRNLDGDELPLPAGSKFEIRLTDEQRERWGV